MKQRDILRAWTPLELAWLLMAVEGPFIAAVIARLTAPTLNLAAFGVAFPFALLFESPIILIMSASTALVADRDSYRKLRRFTWVLNGLITLAMLVFVMPPVFRWVSQGLMGLPDSVAQLAHGACILFLPWPAAIGFRRFYQGLLIRKGLTRRITYATTVRLGCMGGTALLLGIFSRLPGVWIGAAAMSAGVVLEAVASRLWSRDCVREIEGTPTEGRPLSYRAIRVFYLPLALTAMLNLGTQPLVSFFLGHSLMGVESLAVFPVVNFFIFIFSTAGFTLQEVAIPFLAQDAEARPALRRFTTTTAAAVTALLLLMALTPLGGLWLRHAAGLTPHLAGFAALPVAILAILPALTLVEGYQRACLLARHTTRPITWATGLEVAILAVVLLLLTRGAGWVGATAAACAMVTGRLGACFLLKRATA